MRRIRRHRWLGLAVTLMVVACGCGDRALPAPAPSPAAEKTAASESPAAANDMTLARILVVDMDGKPLANMMPVATAKPNAFDKPIATGQLTGPDGKGYVTIPQSLWLCVRAWDPTQRMFANNYYDVLPGKAETTDEMRIVMLPGATLDAVLTGPDGTPFANENVGMMMSHPTRGPWWPAESKTDVHGAVHFEFVPAGSYQITLETASGKQIELPEVALPPGGGARLGPVALQ